MDERNQIIMDSLISMIKKLRIECLIKDSEIETLKKKLEDKEVSNGIL